MIKKYYWCLIHCEEIGKSIHNLLIKLEKKKFLWICPLLRVFLKTNSLGWFLCNIYHMPQPLNLNVEKSYQNEARKYCYEIFLFCYIMLTWEVMVVIFISISYFPHTLTDEISCFSYSFYSGCYILHDQ